MDTAVKDFGLAITAEVTAHEVGLELADKAAGIEGVQPLSEM